jgi:hypothetical protein
VTLLADVRVYVSTMIHMGFANGSQRLHRHISPAGGSVIPRVFPNTRAISNLTDRPRPIGFFAGFGYCVGYWCRRFEWFRSHTMAVRLILVDDQQVIRMGFASLLAGNDIEIIAEAANGLEAIEKTKQLEPDVVLMGVGMPEMDGFDALEESGRRRRA